MASIPSAPPQPPDTRTPEQRLADYQNTAPPPPPPGKKITEGRWVGNQWVDWAVVPDLPDYPYGPVQVKPVAAPVPPPDNTNTPTTTAPDTGGGGSGGSAPAPAAPQTTVSSTYNDIIQQLLNMSGPSYSSQNYTQPTRTPTTLNLPPPSEYDALVKAQIQKMLAGPTAEEAGQAAANSIPVSAYRNSMLRDLGVQQAGAAEASGLNGTQGSGGFAGRTEALRQAAGEKTAEFTGQYVDKAMADRRAELQRALEMAQQQGNFEDAQALSAELARLNLEEDRYKSDLSLYSTNVNADLTREQLANQRYATEVQKLLGLSDVEMRRYLGDIQNQTSRYGIDTTALTALHGQQIDWERMRTDNVYRDEVLALMAKG